MKNETGIKFTSFNLIYIFCFVPEGYYKFYCRRSCIKLWTHRIESISLPLVIKNVWMIHTPRHDPWKKYTIVNKKCCRESP